MKARASAVALGLLVSFEQVTTYQMFTPLF
jgi:hypothetical protein